MSALGFVPDWPAPPTVTAHQTCRDGGQSTGAYASLNLARHVDDSIENVQANRRLVAAKLKLPSEPCWLDQVHGCRIVDLDRPWSGVADGAVTSQAGVVCAVMTADCLPVLITDRAGSRVGVAHAGWRGMLAGVIPAAVTALGVTGSEVIAWLGPAIGPRAYEVGDEVRAAFAAVEPESSVAFAANRRGRWQADLYRLARLSLESAGVTEVYGGTECTYSAADRYFSHRREAPCGRQASLIWIEPRHASLDSGH